MLKCAAASFPGSLVEVRVLEVGEHDHKNLRVKCCLRLVFHGMGDSQNKICAEATYQIVVLSYQE